MEKKRIFSLVLAAILVCTTLPSYADETEENSDTIEIEANGNELELIEERQGQISQNNQMIQEQKLNIEEANANLDEAFKSLNQLEEEMNKLKAEIESLEAEIKELNNKIKLNEAEKTALESKLELKVSVFKKRLDVMYKNRNSGYISVLLASDDVNDFLSKLTTMKTVAEHDKNLIKEMKETKKQLDLVIIQLKGQKASRDEAYQNLNIKKGELMDKIFDQKQLITAIQTNVNLAENEIARLNGLVQTLNSEISVLSEQYQERLRREEEERRRQEEERLARERALAEEARREAEEAASTLSSYSGGNILPQGTPVPFNGSVVYFNQRDNPWGSAKYGSGWASTIEANGCGPTSMAMVISSMTSANVTPIDMANYSMANGHCMPGDQGSYWSLFPAAASQYGLNCRQTSSRSEIINALANGAMVICSQNNALGNYWTYGGHFIVLTGVTESGNIRVADPWSYEKSARSHTQDQVFIPMRSAWIITN